MEIKAIPCKSIQPNPQQPRRHFDPAALAELSASIKAHGGVEQPIVVTLNGGPNSYILVSGERRWRATQQAGLPTIDAIIKPKKSDRELAESALLENLHRADLSAVEEARAYQYLIDRHGLSVLDVADRTGKATSQIYNRLTWLKLEEAIQELVVAGQLQGDVKVATALLKLPAGRTRVDLAKKLSQSHATLQAILLACNKLVDQQSARHPTTDRDQHPMKHQAISQSGVKPAAGAAYPLPAVRAAAKAMCARCDIQTDVLRGQVAEPAWTLIAHAADAVCEACNVRSVRGACAACPGVDLLRRLLDSTTGTTHA